MPVTQISNVVVPEVFNPYVLQRTAELSAVRASGIAAEVPGVTVPNGGATLNMPFWNDINSDDEVLSDTVELTPDKITAGKDVAAILTRGKAWAANDLSALFSGDDPLGAIANMVSTYWARKEQKTLLSILAGVFASTSMTGNLLDISGEDGDAAIISSASLIDAISLLGDAAYSLTGIITHSAVMYDLAKKNLLDAKISGINVKTAPEFQSYLGRQIIVDDSAPNDAGVYTTYLFGQGAVGFAEGNVPVPTEVERKALAGNDYLVNRRSFILHPRGVKWVGTPSGSTPSNTELAAGTNWVRVYDNKNIRIVAFKHKIGATGSNSGGGSEE
jgi:hypothetical protein